MPFLLLCGLPAFLFQFFALRVSPRRRVHILTFTLLELPPLLMILYCAIVRPHSFLFDWVANALFGLYIAGAVLLGCACAWLTELLRKFRQLPAD